MTERARLPDALALAARPREREYAIHAAALQGFMLRVQPNGARSWVFRFRRDGKPRRVTLGKPGVVKADEARAAALARMEAVNGDGHHELLQQRDPARSRPSSRRCRCARRCRPLLAVGGGVTIASGTAEREAALDLIDRHRPVESRGGRRRITVGGDKGFDVADFVEELRHRKVTPHIAVQDHVTKTGKRRKTKIDGRTTRHPGYGVSQRCRKRIEEVFGWVKTSAGLSKTKFRGRHRVDASFTLALAAYNLVRLPRLLAEAPT